MLQRRNIAIGFDDHLDSYNDTIANGCDNCPFLANLNQFDNDHDGVGDACDICAGGNDHKDADNDGVPDFCDLCPAFNDRILTNCTAVTDTDSTIFNASCVEVPSGRNYIDTDNDGIPDQCDNCPSAPNRDQADADHDGVGNVCDKCDLTNVLQRNSTTTGSSNFRDTDGDGK